MDICLHTFWDITHDFIGGTERFIIELSKELSTLGYRPFIVCSGNNVQTNIQGIPVFGVLPPQYIDSFSFFGEAKLGFLNEHFVHKKSYMEGLKALSNYVQYQVSQFESDVIHLNSFASSMFFSSNKPVIVTNHENELESDNLWGKGFFNELIKISKREDSFFTKHYALAVPSKFYAREYSELFEVPIHGINIGVNLSTFGKINFINHKSNQDRSLRVLLPSRLDPKQKGHDIALRACRKLVRKGIDVKMIFSGVRRDNQGTVDVLREKAGYLGILENIVIKSFAEIQCAYNEVDIIISPERYCSYGLSISEALAIGKPTVLSDIPTYLEIAKGYSHAYFFESGCSSSLAEKIMEAFENSSKPSNIDLIKFRSKFDLRECARQYSALYLNSVE